VDPLNRAVEAAWASGLVVVAAASNAGPAAQTITVPGNDPYVITVGALNTNRTPGDWSDDYIPAWSSTGPTLDGFAKPDVVAPGSSVISFMYNHPHQITLSAKLVQEHPDYSVNTTLFRMSGTSMATAVASGVVALMLGEHPETDAEPGQISVVVFGAAGSERGRRTDIHHFPAGRGAHLGTGCSVGKFLAR